MHPRGFLLGLVTVVVAPIGRADVVTIEPTKDNTLYVDVGGGLSNGAGQHLFVGLNGLDQERRAVLEFDVAASVPAGATITDASLDLFCSITVVGREDVALHVATSEWGEGTSVGIGEEGTGNVVTTDDATWLHTFYSTQFWTTPGGDFVATPSATTSVDFTGHYQWSGAQVIADVQSWLDAPSGNHGWLLLGNEADPPPTAKRFSSRQNADPLQRPMLTITFDPPAPPTYCTPKTSSAGCVTRITTSDPSAQPVSLASDYAVIALNPQEGKNGLLFASTAGAASIPFNGGTLCMLPPLKRGPILFSGGDDANECDGSYSTTVNELLLPMGLDPGAGNTAWYQYWYRDPLNGAGPAGTSLSDAIQLDYL